MIRKTTTILLFFFSQLAYCQKIEYQLFIYDNCTNRVNSADFYTLSKDTLHFLSEADSSGICYVREYGRYNCFPFLNGIADSLVIDILPNNLIDTICKLRVQEFFDLYNFPPNVYECCGKPCEGIIIDYDLSNTKRIEGHFHNGRPRDTLFIYDNSGMLTEKSYFHPKRRLMIINNRDGTIQYSDWDRNISKEYYDNGHLKSFRNTKSKSRYKEEYFSKNGVKQKGITNRKLITYHQNGKKSECYEKRLNYFETIASLDMPSGSRKVFDCKYSSWDSAGVIQKMAKFSMWYPQDYYFPPDFKEIKQNDFYLTIYYQNGLKSKKEIYSYNKYDVYIYDDKWIYNKTVKFE
jgi:hypothetical protein